VANRNGDHQTIVQFTGSGHRAHCTTAGCRFIGQTHSMIRTMAMGYTQAMSWHQTKTLAEDDARRHCADQRRKAERETR
jgi:hypothetical protein